MQILLRNRATKVNAQMHDGTTPLMLAVRLAVEGMVEELINADADVNATDAQGMIACRFLPRDAMHSADCAVGSSACPSVCPSHAGIPSERVATSSQFLYSKRYGNILTAR